MTHKYDYNKIKKEATAYKFKFPTYEKYITRKNFYDVWHKKKRKKYVLGLMKKGCVIGCNNDGLICILY